MPPSSPSRPSTAVEVDLDLIERYNQSGPRYTSYPTAPHFDESYGPEAFAEDLRRADSEAPLSLYTHLPFCRQLCYYCGCHMKVTQKPETIERYLDHLKREIDLLAEQIDTRRPVVQLHWGGGTPTYLTADQIADLGRYLRDRFSFADDVEMGLEADPRGLTEDRIAAAASVGFNRLSLGVQDINPDVQEAINRIQPPELVEKGVRWAREHGFSSINLDLVYGLPLQTTDRFDDTLDFTLDLQPDRIALFSYAHVPSVLKHQRVIDEDDLPAPEEKMRTFKRSMERLTGPGGYRHIGMDHFARPDDDLARAQDSGDLHRNFQGYSTKADADVLAFGVSGIHQLSGAYAQNVKGLNPYYDRVTDGDLGVYRGYRLTEEDRLRRHVIMELMCHFRVEKSDVEDRFGIDFDTTFAPALDTLKPMEADGLVTLGTDAVEVNDRGRLLIRNVAMAFDAYLQSRTDDQPTYSKTV